MYKKKNNNITERIFANQYIVSIVGFIVIVSIALPLFKNINKQHQVNIEIKELEEEIDQMENKNSQLKNLIGYLESDDFINEQARLQLNYKAEGEEVVVIQNKEDQNLSSKDNNANLLYNKNEGDNLNRENNPVKWWNHFFSK